ncbi:MAG: hypothetical protein LW701_02710, partial [Fluviicola sp.]|nr:hypothetical protein [Fluviicola sp.]
MKLRLIILLFFPFVSFSANWYVDDATVNDANDIYNTTGSVVGTVAGTGSISSPFLTLNAAISAASSGDFIYIDAGTYNEHGLLVPAAKTGVSIIGAGYQYTIFDHLFGGTATDYFMCIQASNTTLQAIKVTGYENNGTQFPGHNGQALTINGTGSTITGILIQDVMFLGNGQSGGNPAISVLSRSSVTITGGGGFCNTTGTQYTGGVEAYGTNINLTIDNYLLGNNYKYGAYDGGGLYIANGDATTIVNVTNTRIKNNIAVNGGGVFQNSGVLTVTDCIIEGNGAGQTSSNVYGGGVGMYGGTATYTRVKFLNNGLAPAGGTLKGGGIGVFPLINDVILNVVNCYFSGNGGVGPDIYARPNSSHEYQISCSETTFSSSNPALVENDNSTNTCVGSDFTITNSGNPITLSTNGGGGSSCGINKTNTIAPSSIPNPNIVDYTGGCGAIVIVPPCTAPSAPVIGVITQPTCSVATGSVALSGLPAVGSWTVTASPGGSTLTGSGTTGTFSGLSANTYTFIVTNSTGCSSVSSSSAVINTQPTTPTAPLATLTQPTCSVATGSAAFSNLPAVGSWTVTATPGGATITGSGTTGTFSGLTQSTTYTFTVTNASGCTSTASSNAIINAQPSTPTTPVVGTITQPTCSVATGSVDFSGLPAVGSWTVTASPGGTTLTGSGTTGTFSGLSANTYTFTVTNASGCTSAATPNAVINTQPSTPTTPVVGTITQPTCSLATGSVDFSGLPAVGSWTVTASPGGTTLTGSGTTGTFSGLSANTYTFTVTNASGCTSAATPNTVIDAQPSTPTTLVVGTITQPTCILATGSVDFSGLPAVGSWTVTASPGGTT